jgi:hypothetical protein
MSIAPVKDQSAQLSTGRHAWLLAKSLTGDSKRAVSWLMPRRRERNLVVGLTAYVLASNLWPWPTFIASMVGVYVAWRTAPGEWARLRWSLRGDRKYDAFVDCMFTMAGAGKSPTIRRDAKGNAEVSISERSWTFQLLAPQGGDGKTAAELCRMWPRIKNEIGEGCISVNCHERTGNHFTMVVVWQRFAGERAVRISRDRIIIVHGFQRFPDLVRNPSLDGWVRSEYRHAGEWHGKEDADTVPELDPRDRMWGDDEDERHAVEEVEPEQAEEVDEDEDEPYEPPIVKPTWAPNPQVVQAELDIYDGGVGEPSSTPPPVVDLEPDPFAAPPTGPMVGAGLFHPTASSAGFRPTGAAPGTATGALWDLVQAGPARTTRELAQLSGLSAGAAGNALSRWRKLGFVGGDDGRWLPTNSTIATVALDGDQETA